MQSHDCMSKHTISLRARGERYLLSGLSCKICALTGSQATEFCYITSKYTALTRRACKLTASFCNGISTGCRVTCEESKTIVTFFGMHFRGRKKSVWRHGRAVHHALHHPAERGKLRQWIARRLSGAPCGFYGSVPVLPNCLHTWDRYHHGFAWSKKWICTRLMLLLSKYSPFWAFIWVTPQWVKLHCTI